MNETVQTTLPTEQRTFDTDIWNILQDAAMAKVNDLVNSIQQIAPNPGFLVYIEAKRLSYSWKGWRPILFSAIDVCTHLQIARMYLIPNSASAIDALDFIAERYPFPIREVRTTADPLFTHPASIQSEHQFTNKAKQLGMFHSIVLDPSNHPILRIISKYQFGGTFEGSIEKPTEENVMAALVNYLFFHNNHRSLASLGGLTPLQKLKSFDGFEKIELFDPYRPLSTNGTNSF
jgi:hypothetical protein